MVALPHVMDLIDTLLMTPQEALLEAATTDDESWVHGLLNAYRDTQRSPLYLTDALVAAASGGCMGSFDILLWEGIAAYHGPLYDLPEAIRDMVVKDIVEYVVKEVVDGDENDDSGRIVPPWSDIHLVLEGAASNGHLDVVKFLTNHARENGYVEGLTMHSRSSSDALTCAILGKHGEVVEYLMTLVDEFRWNMKLAFEAAVRGDQHVLAERIYEMYPSTVQGENLFVALVRDGGTNAIKYLYDNGRDDLDLLNGAFLVAAENGSTGVIDFLLETGRISSEIFDEAFVAASGSVLRAKTVSSLYEKKRATSEAINKVFASTHSFAVTKLLYENEVIPREAIIAAFRKATLYGIGHFFRLTKDKLDTVRLLCELDCIRAEVIGKAYSDAATRHLTQIMELLRDHRKLFISGTYSINT
ncbi:hypothetical protein PF008_g17933 [Phytophthora fragariae]|uniref:Ankyrin repeat protein n=1 Tax=Phytophthora fragariae TaxID=53985 RepID=A0A6G0R765_9STRA|nr:hypothetical protein PF008_g17933 [Phytophthora fragariae]